MGRVKATLVVALVVLSVFAVPVAGQTVDPNEPNNGLASATQVTDGRYPSNLTDGDKDFFELNLNKGDVVRLEAKYDDEAGSLGLEVVRPDNDDWDSDPQIIDYAQSVDTDQVVAFTAKHQGRYFARVTRDGDGTATIPYTLLVNRTTPSEGDSYEPNYASSNAAVISQGRHPAELLAGEKDFYAIHLNKGDVLDTRLKYDQSAGDLRIKAYKPDGPDYDSELDWVDTGDIYDSDRYVEFTAKQNATYYLKVYGDNEDTTSAPYTLLVDRIEPNETDPYEVNFNTSLAAPISEGTYSAEILPSDKDYYSIPLNAGDVVNLTLGYSYSKTSDLDVEVYKEDGDDYDNDPDYVTSSSSYNDNAHLAFTAKKNATYYIRVYGDGERDAGKYTLSLDRIEPSETDQFEPNFNIQRAASISEGIYHVQLLPRAEDHYKMELGAGDVVKFEATFDSEVKDPDVEIYREDGEDYDNEPDYVKSSNDYGDTEEIAFTAKKGGTYYINFEGDADGAPQTLNYTINLTRVTPSEGDRYEANYDYEASAVVDAGSYSGTLLWGEEDYYVIGLQKGDIMSASAIFNDSIENLDMRLYAPDDKDDDSRPEHYKDSTSYDDNEDISLTAPRTGLYYVDIYSDDEDRQPVPYDLTIARTKNETTPLSIDTQKAATLAGDSVTVTYTITNTQRSAVSDVTLDLGTLPGGWQVLGQSSAGGTWDEMNLKWHWDTVAGREVKKVTITYQVPDGAVPDIEAIIGTVSAAGDISDIEPSVVVVGKTDINSRPTPRFTYLPQNISTGDTVTFDASASTDDGYITQYTWEFPDDTVVTTDPVVNHTFTTSGDVSVGLTAKDNQSASSTTTRTLHIQEPQVPVYDVTYSLSTTSTTIDDRIRIDATIANTGGADGATNVTFYTDGTAAKTINVSVDEDTTKTVSYYTGFSTTGNHSVHVENLEPTTVTVQEQSSSGSVVDQYDTDGNGIDTVELLRGIGDYRSGNISVTKIFKLLTSWRSNM